MHQGQPHNMPVQLWQAIAPLAWSPIPVQWAKQNEKAVREPKNSTIPLPSRACLAYLAEVPQCLWPASESLAGQQTRHGSLSLSIAGQGLVFPPLQKASGRNFASFSVSFVWRRSIIWSWRGSPTQQGLVSARLLPSDSGFALCLILHGLTIYGL